MKTVNEIKHVKIRSNYAVGLAYKGEGIIHIDTRLVGFNHLETLIHEILHIQNPKWSEIKVIGHSKEIATLLWQQGYRKVDI